MERGIMEYKIIVDSCCEFLPEWEGDERFERIPLGLEIDGEVTMDDETFNQAAFLKRISKSRHCPKSFCPSPEQYAEAMDNDADMIFVFTLSSKVSGSFNSAAVGRSIAIRRSKERGLGRRKIFVCDSKSASGGETQLVIKCRQLIEEGREFGDICLKLMFMRNEMKTFFVLDNLETLRKNGRLTGVKAIAGSALNIKPILTVSDGEICQAGAGLGTHKALEKMIDEMKDEICRPEDKTVIISQCHAKERALEIKHMIESKVRVKRVIIMDTGGISTMYANDGGVIVTC